MGGWEGPPMGGRGPWEAGMGANKRMRMEDMGPRGGGGDPGRENHELRAENQELRRKVGDSSSSP